MRTPCNSLPSLRDAGEKVELELAADVVMTFAWCPAGSFRMGGTVHNDEQPVHKVTLTKGFCMGIYPVTQAQWKAVMGTDPSHFKGANRPVESVTWHECNEFCTKLSGLLTGRVTVRLPSKPSGNMHAGLEPQQEYHFGNVINTDLANYDGNYSFNDSPKGKCRKETTDVGSFPANSWGITTFTATSGSGAATGSVHTPKPITPMQRNNQSITLTFYVVVPGATVRSLPRRISQQEPPAYCGCNCGFRVCFRAGLLTMNGWCWTWARTGCVTSSM